MTEQLTPGQIRYRKYRKTYEKQRDRLLFGSLREVIIKRDGEKCVICGMSREEHKLRFGVDISVNHINGKGRHHYERGLVMDNSPENLETLCIACHGRKDAKKNFGSSDEEKEMCVWIGGLIKKARKKMGENQTEFAERFNVKKNTVCNWEKGIRHASYACIITTFMELDMLKDELQTIKKGK